MAINIYEPMKFRTQGIEDLATKDSLVITNGKITIDTVESKLNLDFSASNFNDLENKGIRWTDGNKSKKFIYKNSQILSDLTINLAEEQTFKIADVNVLSLTELGATVTKSKLKEVGILRNLKVAGSAILGEFTYVNSDINRVGINTDSPASALGIRENGVDIVLGSSKTKTAHIGTFSNDSLELITDGQARITLARDGQIIIGNEQTDNGVLRVHGSIYATEIVTERTGSIFIKEANDDTIYGKGLIWKTARGPNKQFIYSMNPDRIRSTETIDLDEERYFSIGAAMVISKTSLGSTVVDSNLSSVGVLRELQVSGDAAIARRLSTNRIEVGRFGIDENRLEAQREFTVTVNGANEIQLGSTISIGNSSNPNRTVSVFGQLAVGAANASPGMALTVNGPVDIDGKKFYQGIRPPSEGQYNRGDIVWNTEPKPNDFIGWVCVTPGTPGSWFPFGAVSSR